MDGSTLRPESFIFEFPVWIIASSDGVRGRRRIRPTLLSDDHSGAVAFPVFTDLDLAERFIRDSSTKGVLPRRIKTPARLARYATEARDEGVAIAAFDLAGRPGPHKRLLSIESLLAYLKGLDE